MMVVVVGSPNRVCQRSHEDVDMDMDLSSPSKPAPASLPTDDATATPAFDGWGPGMHHEDIELRTRIVNSVIEGDIDRALAETARHHPKVLEWEEVAPHHAGDLRQGDGHRCTFVSLLLLMARMLGV
jgi:hypothetical protein